jgi:hypothetical protein
MRTAKQQGCLGRSTWTVMVLSIIALVLVLSIAVTSGGSHSLDQITLALPVFFVLLFLATWISDWLPPENFFVEAGPCLSTSHTRAPPA